MKHFKEYLFLGIGSLLLGGTLFLSYSATAQTKTFTIEEAVLGGGGKLIPKNPDQLQWVAGTSNYSQVIENVITIIDAKSGNIVSRVPKNEIDRSLKNAYSSDDTLKRFPKIAWLSATQFKFMANNKIYAYSLSDKSTKMLAKYNASLMENADIEPVSHKVAYTQGNNLFIDDQQITNDTKAGIVNGQAVHRNEFGILKGTFWSNNGEKLAFYHLDESMVAEYPIYQLNNRPANSRNIRYPIAGTPSHHATIGVYNTITKSTIYLNTGTPAEQYLTNITWSPDGNSIYVAVVNRAQNHLWLNQYNAENGAYMKTLFEETNDKYVEPEHGPIFVKNDPAKFIWWSERDTFNHLYLYDISGKLLKQLTKGKWVVTDVHGFDKSGLNLFYTSTVKGATQRHLQSVNIKTGKTTLLTGNREGTHTITLSPDGDCYLDNFQNLTTPREVSVVFVNSKKETSIFKANNPLTEYQLGEIELGVLKANDGTPLHYRLIKPINFNADKKYPVIVYLYNGPHLQLVNNTWLGGGKSLDAIYGSKRFCCFFYRRQRFLK